MKAIGDFRAALALLLGLLFLFIVTACDDDDGDGHGVPDATDNACAIEISHPAGDYSAPFTATLSCECDAMLFYRRDFADGTWEGDFLADHNPATIRIERDQTLTVWAVTAAGRELEPVAQTYSLPPYFRGIAYAHSGDERITLQWQPAWDADGPVIYRIYQPVEGEPLPTLQPVVQTAATDVTLSNIHLELTNGRSACFVVRAMDARGFEDANAIERCLPPYPVHYVDAGASPGGDGSRGLPFDSLQAASDALVEEGSFTALHVAGGVYTENPNFTLNDPPYAESLHAVLAFGGFDPDTWRRDVPSQPTILDGQGADVWRLGEGDFIDGFIVTGGGDGFVLQDLRSVTVFNCALRDNDGAAIAVRASDVISGPSITATTIIGNNIGVLLSTDADPDSRTGTNPLLRNVIVAENGDGLIARASGGGPFNVELGARIRNAVFYGNDSGLTIDAGGGFLTLGFEITNSYLGGDLNCTDCGAGVFGLHYCDVADAGAFTGPGVFSAAPGFLDPPDDFRLAEDSPLIDAGAPDALLADPDGSRGDVGAFGGPGAWWLELNTGF
ncbi:MAG: hypothetical protein P9L99_02615 [Candidatus Lernaella stagnicola]|nr:hypothetical protein [Candidatus Lernaella stagnicola]